MNALVLIFNGTACMGALDIDRTVPLSGLGGRLRFSRSPYAYNTCQLNRWVSSIRLTPP